jgi:hypothetical protein
MIAALALPCTAAAGNPITGKTAGHCKLANVDHGKELYNGTCNIKETVNGQNVLFDIKMGSAESFLFATADGGTTWMHGPERVKFKDRGDTAIFRWGSFRLELEAD